MRRHISFDSLEDRKLLSGDLNTDPNYDVNLGWLPEIGQIDTGSFYIDIMEHPEILDNLVPGDFKFIKPIEPLKDPTIYYQGEPGLNPLSPYGSDALLYPR